MKKEKKEVILVTGGKGMVGQFLREIMPDAIYVNCGYMSDNYDFTCEHDVSDMYDRYKPDIVIHLAAKVGGIMDNINSPAEYFTSNILMNTLLIEYAKLNKVKRFIGILSTCIYPDTLSDDNYPLNENTLHLGPPTITNFSYGYAKRAMAVQIDAYNKQYDTNYQYLIPCNLYGEYDKYGKNSHFVGALLDKIIKANKNKEETITLFGTGAPLRQFMYGGDLARVIKYCVDNNITESFNVATDENLSIKEIAEIAVSVTKNNIKQINFDSTKPDGQYRKDVSTEKLKLLIPDFKATSLHDGIEKTFKIISSSKFKIRK